MLDSKRIERFFSNNPDGVVMIVQSDGVFKLTENIPFSLDTNSITLLDIDFNRKVYGNVYSRHGHFMIPFHSIIRVEYLTEVDGMSYE